MKRMTKTSGTAESTNVSRTAQPKFTSKSHEGELADNLGNSPAMTAQRMKLQSLFGGAIQRVEPDEDMKPGAAQLAMEEEQIQAKADTAQLLEKDEEKQLKADPVQRKDEDDDLSKKTAQPKFSAQAAMQLQEAPAAKPNNTGLPDNLKHGIENLSGMSMDSVKVHYNSSQPAQLNALAYAQGSDIHVAPGQEQHLPHEAWHVVQQAQGRVTPTMQMKEGVPVNDDRSLEHEADVMGTRAASMGVVQGKSIDSGHTGSIAGQHAVQRAEAFLGIDPNGKGAQLKSDGNLFYNGQSVYVHDANPVVQMFLGTLFGTVKSGMLTVEALGHITAGIALLVAGIPMTATPAAILGIATTVAGACQCLIGISKAIRAHLMSKYQDNPGQIAGVLGALISVEGVLWAACTPAAFIAGGGLSIAAGVVSAAGSLVKIVRGVLSGLKLIGSKVKGALIIIEAICGLFGSISGLVTKAIAKAVAGIVSKAASTIVNFVKGFRGGVTAGD